MTPEEKLTILEGKVADLERAVAMSMNYTDIPLELENSFMARGFIKATRLIPAITPYDSRNNTDGIVQVWVASSSGGAVTHSITFKDGIIIAVT